MTKIKTATTVNIDARKVRTLVYEKLGILSNGDWKWLKACLNAKKIYLMGEKWSCDLKEWVHKEKRITKWGKRFLFCFSATFLVFLELFI